MQEGTMVDQILGVNIAMGSRADTAERCIAWAKAGESREVLFANVHVVMEAWDDPHLRTNMNGADLVNADGMPLVWGLRALGHHDARRVYGPDTMAALLQVARDEHVPIAFYGGRPDTLKALVEIVEQSYPGIDIRYAISPPFRELSGEEDARMIQQLNESGARMLFLGLGCPKQERWIFDHRGRHSMVVLAVGAAFDFLSGKKAQAPRWMMRSGLEWAFRFASEPRRLAGRYLKHNPRFVVLFLRQWITKRPHGVRQGTVVVDGSAAPRFGNVSLATSCLHPHMTAVPPQVPTLLGDVMAEKEDLYVL